MKKIYILITLLCLLTVAVKGQQNQFFDAPFGLGGGFTPSWYFTDVNIINEQLKIAGFPEISSSGLFTSGGGGFVYIGFIPNLRVGGMGFGGSSSESSTVSGERREAIYSLGGGGVTIEYTFPFIKNVGVSVGGTIGGGSLKLELYKNSGSFNWNGIWDDITNTETSSFSRSIQKSFWIFSPTINVDIPVYRLVAVRVGAGYLITTGGSWRLDNDQPLNDVPSGLNANSFFIQTGIFIGFFSY